MRLVDVKALEKFRIRVRFEDGLEGELDLGHLAGKGVFKAWMEDAFFEQVTLGPGGSASWSEEIELCPDSLYMQLTGKSAAEVFESEKATHKSA